MAMSVRFDMRVLVMRRAHEWGTLFAPSVVSDFQELKSIVPALLGRHDWLWEDKYPEQEKTMADFYTRRGAYSYVRESKINRNLVEEAIKAGFALAGHMDIDRQPVLLPAAEQAGKIYGSLTPNVQASTVLRRAGDGQWEKVGNAAPFTPLFFFKGDRGKILEAVAAKEGEDIDRIRSMSLQFFR